MPAPGGDLTARPVLRCRFKVREGAELQSRAIKNTREPHWGGEEFAFLVHEPTHQALHLVMWDKDIVGKDEQVGW